MLLVSSCSCLCPIHWSQVLSWELRCSWMLQLHLSERQFYCLLGCALYQRFYGISTIQHMLNFLDNALYCVCWSVISYRNFLFHFFSSIKKTNKQGYWWLPYELYLFCLLCKFLWDLLPNIIAALLCSHFSHSVNHDVSEGTVMYEVECPRQSWGRSMVIY